MTDSLRRWVEKGLPRWSGRAFLHETELVLPVTLKCFRFHFFVSAVDYHQLLVGDWPTTAETRQRAPASYMWHTRYPTLPKADYIRHFSIRVDRMDGILDMRRPGGTSSKTAWVQVASRSNATHPYSTYNLELYTERERATLGFTKREREVESSSSCLRVRVSPLRSSWWGFC